MLQWAVHTVTTVQWLSTVCKRMVQDCYFVFTEFTSTERLMLS